MSNKRKDLKIEGSNLWYLVGLITTDGCLSKDGRHIDITSKEYAFLQDIKEALGFDNKIGIKYNTQRQKSFHIQIANKNFYDFLVSIGLMPGKSLILKGIDTPNKYFIDFLRGVIDGDGCIRRWIHPSNNAEQWSLRIYSGSEKFIKWLQGITEELLKIKGGIYKEADTKWTLKYGKMAAKEIVKRCYYGDCLGLNRKIKLAEKCLGSYRGWSRSKTVLN